uniref:Aminopeptidase n=1 Tax=Anabas testudineus TaxID=64144 RepID=A0A7N6AP20_ANATE
MGKGFYISKAVGIVGIVLCAGALATIIALSVVYSQEKAKNNNQVLPTDGGLTTKPTVTPAPTSTPSSELWDKYRLPKSLVPLNYYVTLRPHLTPDPTTKLYIFEGESTVEFECVEDTDLIIIHSHKLNYSDSEKTLGVRLTPVNDAVNVPTIKSAWLQPVTQYLVVQLNGKLTSGNRYQLSTKFTGELADDLGGFYRSEYKEDGVTKIVATTQMQPTDARKAFPCFDEPAMKAVFYITLIHDHGTIALSNAEEKESTNVTIAGQDLRMTVFEPTKKMSTYLLAFIVCDFDFISNTTDQLLIRIFARKSAIAADQGEYALNKTGPILKFFEKYYNSSYPLPKSDQIALPDFNAGAMENWGLITYRETALLYDEAYSSSSNKERIATIIAHELAHMWFGNLVTLRWWNDLWLNEGFASYVEYLGAHEAEPDWNVKDLIVLSDVHRVFAIDALASSHPLTSNEDDIQKPAQISELFDAISYSKGASVLRMLSDFLTEDVFTMGLQTYLAEFAFGNAVYTDLWNHLQTAVIASKTDLPDTVHNIMNTWVLQMGFPVVTIDTTTGVISQKHFLLDPNSEITTPSPFKYSIYITQHWYKNSTGIKSSISLSPIIKCPILFQRAQIISTVLALNTTKYLIREREYMPWQSTLNNLDFFYLMFDRTEVYGPMQDYLRKQVTPLFDYYKTMTDNWSKVPDKHMDQYNQVNAISLACRTGLEECQTLATTWFEQWRTTNINPIHPNLRSTIYCNAIAAGGAVEWDFAWSQFLNATIAIEADKLRSALACTKQPWLLNRYLEYTLNPTLIRKQDATSTIVYIANNVVGQPLAWDFVRARWSYIFTEYGGGSFSFSNLINGVTKRFSTQFELDQVRLVCAIILSIFCLYEICCHLTCCSSNRELSCMCVLFVVTAGAVQGRQC